MKRRFPYDATTAYRFTYQTGELINQLLHFGHARLMVRGQGLSLVKATRFGLFISPRHGHSVRDHVSELLVDLPTNPWVYLVPSPIQGPPVLALSEPGKPIAVSIELEAHEWSSPLLQKLLTTFGGVPVEAQLIRDRGADAWLDQWTEATSGILTRNDRWNVIAALDACRRFEVQLSTPGCSVHAEFNPAFVDFDHAVLRVADTRCGHVVYADLSSPEVRYDLVGETFIIRQNAAPVIPTIHELSPSLPFPRVA